MSFVQRAFKFFLSDKTFNRMKAESQEWYFTCDCGSEFSVWDIGGIRYRARGNPIRVVTCVKCHKTAARRFQRK